MVAAEPKQNLKISVAVLTRQRPRMLAELIKSFGHMELPENCEVRCLIVENDKEPNTKDLVYSLFPLPNGLEVDYVLETDLGIPQARNRAAREALESRADVMTFVDDDEIVDEHWLSELVSSYRMGGCSLIGGPVRITLQDKNLSWIERSMYNGVQKHFEKLEAKANASTKENPQPVVTNNWLADVSLFGYENIWFDESLRFTGGSDSKFFRDVTTKGFKSRWNPDAIVYAVMPKDRLSFWDQFRTARDRTMNRFHLVLKNRKAAKVRLLFSVPIKVMVITALVIAVPFTRGKTLYGVARTAGWVVGRIGAAFGGKSKLYTKILGN